METSPEELTVRQALRLAAQHVEQTHNLAPRPAKAYVHNEMSYAEFTTLLRNLGIQGTVSP